MDVNEVVDPIVQVQATKGQLIEDYVKGAYGGSPMAIAEHYGLRLETVKDILTEAEAAGKFIPAGETAALVDKVTDTPSVTPIVEGETPATVEKAPKMATTKNQP